MPSTGFHFTGWSGDLTGLTNPVTVTMNSSKVIAASFAINTYTLTVTATNGLVTRSPNQAAYDSNSAVQLTAIPSAGYHFTGWSGDLAGQANPVSVTMNSNKSVTATFAINTFVVTINATNGSVTKNPNQATYDSNSTVQLTALPSTGYHFTSWSGDLTGSANPVSVTINANKNITANFVANAYTLTVAGINGAVARNPDQAVYDSNATVQLTANPLPGYHFTGWSGNFPSGHQLDNPLTVTMDGNKSITGNFAIVSFTLTVNATNGAVSKNPDLAAYDSNSTVQLTAAPSTGYHFTGWSGDLTGSTNPANVIL